MNGRTFQFAQAENLARAFQEEGVDFLFLGKSGAIILGYPGSTQDVAVFPARSPQNGARIVVALRKLGFEIHADIEREIVDCRDFVQIKNGPFDVDLVFALDGIASHSEAKSRRIMFDIFPVANLRDIIASKRASGRTKDFMELPMLESFRQEYEKRNPPLLRSAAEIANDPDDE